MTQAILDSLRTSTAGSRFSPHIRRGAVVAFLTAVLSGSTILACDEARAQSANELLRGSTNQGVGNAPGLLIRPAGTTTASGELLTDEEERDPNTNSNATQQALDEITPPNPFERVDEEEEAEARRTPQSRLGPVQAFPDADDDDEDAQNDPFSDPLPDPAEPLTEEELERERLARLRRVRSVGATEPAQTIREIEEEENPYEALGFEWGAFTLRPTLDLGVAAVSRQGFRETGDEPVEIVSDNEDGVFGQVDFNLAAESNWSRHSLTVEANARFQEGIRGDAEAQPEVGLLATGVLDVTEQTTLTGEIDYSYVREDASSANAQLQNVEAVETASTPSEQTFAGLLTLGHDRGSLFGDVTVGATRTLLGEVDLGDGSTVEQSDNDNTLFTLGLRGGFRASPVFRPFAEGQLGWRINDEETDSADFERNSFGYSLRLGTEIDLGDKLSGEVSIGYVGVDYDDLRLDSLGGISLAAELDWEPRRGTQVGLTLETNTEPSGVEGVSGSIAYAGEATLTQEIRRNLTATLTTGLEFEDFNTIEEDALTARIGAGFTYWFNRNMGVVGNYNHERVMSDDQSREQTNNSIFLGLRLQR